MGCPINKTLKNCPFCGGPALLEQYRIAKTNINGNYEPEVWFIGCKNKCFFVEQYAHHGTMDDAAIAWNTRYEQTDAWGG